MIIYTGCVDDGPIQKEEGLLRVLTISRLSDNSGRLVREDLALHPSEYYDRHMPSLAPPECLVGWWHNKSGKSENDWAIFEESYQRHMRNNAHALHSITALSHEIFNLIDPSSGWPESIILQCACPADTLRCHRNLLAKELKKKVYEINRVIPEIRKWIPKSI